MQTYECVRCTHVRMYNIMHKCTRVCWCYGVRMNVYAFDCDLRVYAHIVYIPPVVRPLCLFPAEY